VPFSPLGGGKGPTAVSSHPQMTLGIIFIVLIALAGIVEWYVYDRAIYWHDDRRDPRNFPPPR
jgi:hypothetical protein